jgi:hypothetical protein
MAFETLKERQSAAWASAPYENVSEQHLNVVGEPDHAAAAGELARVVRPGGRLALATWESDGGVGRMFAVMRRYMPAPPDGAGNPFEWGRREHVERLLGDAFELEYRTGMVPHEGPSGEAMWQLMSAPTARPRPWPPPSTTTRERPCVATSRPSSRSTGRAASSASPGSTC